MWVGLGEGTRGTILPHTACALMATPHLTWTGVASTKASSSPSVKPPTFSSISCFGPGMYLFEGQRKGPALRV